MKIYRHGDVLLKAIKALPKNLKKFNHGILAEGEATGHKHELQTKTKQKSFQIYVNKSGELFVNILVPTPLTHQEHKTLVIEPSIYRVGIEREYDPFEKRINRVQD